MTIAIASAVVFLALVAPALAECPPGFPNVVTKVDGNKVRTPADATLDLTGQVITGMAKGSSALSTLTVSGNGVCITGGRLQGAQDPQVVPWVEGHQKYGAGLLLKGGQGEVVVENMIIANSLQDGITLSGSLPASTTFTMRDTWIRNTSDDGIQNDGGKQILGIEDSLIEAKMGLSIRPGADSGVGGGGLGKGVVPIKRTLINVICVADDRPDGSDRRNPTGAQNNFCGPSRSASGAFKWSAGASGITVDVSDSIVRYEAKNWNGWASMSWPKGNYHNVTVVWDPVRPGTKYQGPGFPAGVTLTTDASVWIKAKASWLAAHGCPDEAKCQQLATGPVVEPPPPVEPPLPAVTLEQATRGVESSVEALRSVVDGGTPEFQALEHSVEVLRSVVGTTP